MAPVRANLAVAFVLCFAMVWRMAAWKGKGTGLASLASGIPPSSSSVLAVNETLRTRELADVVHRVASAVSAASVIQKAAQLADESEASTEQAAEGVEMNRTSMYSNGFSLSLTVTTMTDYQYQKDGSAVKTSLWAPVTLTVIDGVKPGDWFAYRMAKHSRNGDSKGIFVYKHTTPRAQEIFQMMATGAGTEGVTASKLVLLPPDRVESSDLPQWQTIVWFSPIDPVMVQMQDVASQFAWLAPREHGAGIHGAFIYEMKEDSTSDSIYYMRFNVRA